MSIKKRLLAAFLTVLMVAALVPATAVSAAEAKEITLGTYGEDSWENYASGTYNPSTELLLSLSDSTVMYDLYTNRSKYTFTLVLTETTNAANTKTITLAPASFYPATVSENVSGLMLLRFETVEAEEPNQFVPEVGKIYKIDLTVYSGNEAKYHGTMTPTKGVDLTIGTDSATNKPYRKGIPYGEELVKKYPQKATSTPYASEFYSGKYYFYTLLTLTYGDDKTEIEKQENLKKYYYHLTFTGDDGSKVDLPKVFARSYAGTSYLWARFSITEDGFTPKDGVKYKLDGELYKVGGGEDGGDLLMYTFTREDVSNGNTKFKSTGGTIDKESKVLTVTFDKDVAEGVTEGDKWMVSVNGVVYENIAVSLAASGAKNSICLTLPEAVTPEAGETYTIMLKIGTGTYKDTYTTVTVTLPNSLPIIPGNGDANGDGYISIKDVSLILAYLADNEGMEDAVDTEAADTDGSGTVDIADITNLFTLDIFAATRITYSADEFEGDVKNFTFYSAKAEAWGNPSLYWQCNVQLPKTEADYTVNEGKDNYAYQWFFHIREKDTNKPWMSTEAEYVSHGATSTNNIYRLQLGTFTAQLKVGTTYEVVVQVVEKATGKVVAKSGSMELEWTQDFVDHFNNWLTADNAYVPTIPPTDGHPKAAH